MDVLTTESYFQQYPELIWLAVGFALIVVELSVAPGVGLLFAGMAGITLGGLLAFDVVSDLNFSEQLLYFCVLTVAWALVLWKPLKKYLHSSTGSFDMYVGTNAEVVDEPLIKTNTGKVQWSGSQMRAKVHLDAQIDEIAVGQEVYIHEMKNGVMYVDIVPVPKE